MKIKCGKCGISKIHKNFTKSHLTESGYIKTCHSCMHGIKRKNCFNSVKSMELLLNKMHDDLMRSLPC